MGIIEDLKRLERLGDELSEPASKLRNATVNVANEIIANTKELAVGTLLPRNYTIEERCGKNEYTGKRVCYRYLVGNTTIPDLGEEHWDIINGATTLGFFVENDTNNGDYIPLVPRRACIQFAEDIATGLLSEINEFLEKAIKKTAALEAKVLEAEQGQV